MSLLFVLFLRSESNVACAAVVVFFNYCLHLDSYLETEKMNKGVSKFSGQRSEYYNDVCARVFHALCLWSLLVHVRPASWLWTLAFSVLILAELLYTVVLVAIRIDDAYPATPSTEASFARLGGSGYRFGVSVLGKFREKLEIITVTLLCIDLAYPSTRLGLVCLAGLATCVYLNHDNLARKLEAKRATYVANKPKKHTITPQDRSLLMPRQDSVRYEVVYTIGCFDLFHHGHVVLMENLRARGAKLVVGVHDDESIFLLKNKYPIDNTVRRVRNCKQYADIVFVIPSTDPSPYLDAIVDRYVPKHKMAFIRGADMPNFPGRDIAEALMEIQFLPYTEGVSSTMLRNRLTERRRASRAGDDDEEEDVPEEPATPAPASRRSAGGGGGGGADGELKKTDSLLEFNPRVWLRFNNEWVRSDRPLPGTAWVSYGHEFYRHSVNND
jgi:cytidyltransferase-like protein